MLTLGLLFAGFLSAGLISTFGRLVVFVGLDTDDPEFPDGFVAGFVAGVDAGFVAGFAAGRSADFVFESDDFDDDEL